MVNTIFFICWLSILIYVICLAETRKELKFYAIIGGLMGLLFYAEKIF